MPSPLPPDVPVSEDLLQALFEVSLSGVILFRPVFGADETTITDLAYEYLNPAAQHLLNLPERPAESFLTLFPTAQSTGVFPFYRDAFLSGQVGRYQVNYQHDGLNGYYHLVARRQGPLLVVSFTDTNDQPRTHIEEALRDSQTREHAARAEAERQRGELQRVFEQAPVAIAVYRGPKYIIELANATVCRLWGRRAEDIVGLGLFEALPEVAGMGYEELLDGVMATGQPHVVRGMKAYHDRNGQRETVYWDFVYEPVRNAAGVINGAMVVANEVTEQMEARQQLQTLNDELEMRVTARSAEVRAALFETEQQREQLQAQQRLLSQILGQVPASIATMSGPQHRFSFFNNHYQTMVGGRAGLGQTVTQALPEVAEQGFVHLLDQVYATGQAFVGTETAIMLQAPGAEGPEQRYLDFIYQPLFDEQQRPQGILAFVLDVTEKVRNRKQADTLQAAMLGVAQRHAQERQDLLNLFEQSPAGIVLLREPDHRIDYFNSAFTELFPPDEWTGPLRGHTLAEVYPRIQEAGLMALIDEVYRTGASQLVPELPLATLQPGSPRFVTLAYQAYHEQGRIVGVAAFVYDVTEQVLAQQVREAEQAALQRIFEQAPVAIFVLHGPAYVMTIVNPAMQEMLGPPAAELLGRPYFEAMPELAGQGYADFMDQVWRTGQPFTAQEQPAKLRRHRPDETGYFTFVYQPLYDSQGRISDIMCVATDVTAQVLARQQVQGLNKELAAINVQLHATNEELHASNTQLSRTNADLDTFVYSASHDLKSPITNIEGLLTALREHLPPNALQDPTIPRVLDMMGGAVARFQQTLAHLTNVSRLQQSLLDQPAEEVDLPALVEAVRLDILPELTAAAATLTLDIKACPIIHFPAKNLRSVVYNLLSNAVKYRHPDRPAQVTMRCHCTPGQVLLTVQDNGLGLTPNQQAELFRMFRRLHSHVPGSGVGLYMVKKMIENAGGRISVESEAGVGTTFTVALPVAG